MNEQIKKLAEQQGFTGPNFYISLSELEKFAELIVKECIGTCLNDHWEDPQWGAFYANKIKKQFGITP